MTNEQLQNEILKEQLKQLRESNNNQNKPSFVVFILLALFLGGLGAHKFYTGKYLMGVLYLLLCATGLSVVFSIFDIIRACMNRNDFK